MAYYNVYAWTEKPLYEIQGQAPAMTESNPSKRVLPISGSTADMEQRPILLAIEMLSCSATLSALQCRISLLAKAFPRVEQETVQRQRGLLVLPVMMPHFLSLHYEVNVPSGIL